MAEDFQQIEFHLKGKKLNQNIIFNVRILYQSPLINFENKTNKNQSNHSEKSKK